MRMQWIDEYDFILFDFDGLLVNTEELHFEAYQRMCALEGFELKWDFARFTIPAHQSSEELKKQIYACLPGLYVKEPRWDVLVSRKKEIFEKLLTKEKVALMPGVERLLYQLKIRCKPSCVVTNSPIRQIQVLRAQHPILEVIPHWITREDYTQPKPHPECYLKAIHQLAHQGDRFIGFEDTPKGLQALLQTPATAVLVSEDTHPSLKEIPKERYRHIPNFLTSL